MIDSIFGQAALGYVNAGLPVIPLGEEKKLPVTKNGLKDWSDNPEAVKRWWGEKNPRYNVGIVCGVTDKEHTYPNGEPVDWALGVVDVDVHGVDGREFMREWQISHGELPETWTVRTGSGGLQMYYKFHGEVPPNSANGKIGVDFRGNGGYVVAVPSIHPDTGEPYEWSISPDDCELAEADSNVMELIEAIRPAGAETSSGGSNSPSSKKFELPDAVRAGEGRNDTMFRYARSLLSAGLAPEAVKSIVRDANQAHCIPPLKKGELEKTLDSACSKEPGNELRKKSKVNLDGLPQFRVKGSNGKTTIDPNRLGDAVIERYKAIRIDGAPAVWTGKHWDFGKRAIVLAALELAPDARKSVYNEVYDYVALKATYVSSAEYFDGGWYVQFENCTVDIMTLKLVEPKPWMQIFGTCPYEMDIEKAKEPNYLDTFLRSVAAKDKETITFLSEVIGSCMISRIAVPQAVFLVGRAGNTGKGRASNGKSTYITLVRSVAGPRNVAALDISVFNKNDYAAGSLVGKSANLGDDISGEFLTQGALAIFKKLATGETLSTDVKYGERIEFSPVAQHVYSMNDIPRMERVTEGEMRRIAICGFKASFTPGSEGYDPDVKSKLLAPECVMRAAYVGMVAVRGAIERGRFTAIPSMENDLRDIRLGSSSVMRWLDDANVDPLDMDGEPFADWYVQYTTWLDSNKEHNPVKKNKFTEALNTCGYFGDGSFETKQGTYIAPGGVKKRGKLLVYMPAYNG